MKKRLLSLLFCALTISLILVCAGTDTTKPAIKINLVSPTNDDLSGKIATVTFGDALYIDTVLDSSIVVPASNLGQTFTIVVDSVLTPALDYYGINTISPESNELQIMVYPIGYVHGKIIDQNNNLIPNAKLSLSCYSSIRLDVPEAADKTGYFIIPQVPIGKCLLVASTDEAAGQKEIEILQGQPTEVELLIENKIISSGISILSVMVIFVTVLIILVLIFVGFILYHRNKSSLGKKIHTSNSQTFFNEELSHTSYPSLKNDISKKIISTLSDKEKAVIEFLLNNNHKASQFKIRHGTKLPRTTLARTLQTLERKNLVKVEKDGKLVEVSLTSILLG